MTEEVAFITGAASGIGAAVARRLATRGARIGLVDRDESGLADTAAAVAAAGAVSVSRVTDVTDDAAMADAVAHISTELGPLSTVVSCAGVLTAGTVLTTDPTDWNRTLAVNLGGVYLTARHTISRLIDNGGGTFTAIASDAGVWGSQGYSAYSASKHAVVGLVKCLALDHGSQGVRSNTVCPAFVETPMADTAFAGATTGEREFYMSAVPLGRFARPEEVASAVAHLSSAEASYANGLIYRLDGGSTAGYYQPASHL